MRTIFVFIVSMVSIIAMCQTHSSADKLFQAGNYSAAQGEYGALLRSYPREALYLYRYARCAQELGDAQTALEYFEKAGDRYMLKYFYMGEIYMQLWRPEDAIKAYQQYWDNQKHPNERDAYIEEQITRAEKLQRYMRRVERIQVLNKVEAPLDSMLYAFRLRGAAGWFALDSLGALVYTNQRNDRRIWSTPVDSNLLLVSSHRLLDDWTTPDTLPSSINFTERQTAPFLLSDGVTMYFAAQDSNGFGGLDIYISRYNTATETYTSPENIGFPYNSPGNEYFFAVEEWEDGRQIGFLATDRFAEAGKVHIYSFIIPESKQYWKNLPPDSLALYARLECFEEGIIEDDPAVNLISIETDSMPEFVFIINDSTVYHSLKDFQKAEAKEKFLEWQQVAKQQTIDEEQLSRLRMEYSNADAVRQKELTPIILQLENNQSQLLNRCQNLLLEIRTLELKVH